MVCQSCQISHDVQDVCATFVHARAAENAPTGTQVMGRGGALFETDGGEDPLLGSFVGSFRIIRKLGGGGMGAVYLAEHRSIGSRVAIKVLHPHLAAHESLVSRFRAEALAVNLIGHENIVSIFDLGTMASGRHYLVMEYLEGEPLSALASRGGAAPAVFVPILAQVCEALSAAHQRNVIHRDLKPENIFLTRRSGNDHFVKLLDFGIAKLAEADATPQTTAGMIVGTPEYMAPEQFIGAGIDGRSDLYALGTIAYQLATGRLPFSAGNLAAMMLAHRELQAEPPHLINKAIPPVLSEVILKALSKRPEDRFADAAAFRRALLETLKPATEPARPPPPRVVATWPAAVFNPNGQPLRRVVAQDLSRGGVFLCADTFTPPLLSRVRVRLEVQNGELELAGEVVRHVSPVQSAAWGMPPGVGVQWTELSAEDRRKLDRVLAGEPLTVPTPPPSNAQIEEQIARWRRRASRDHYTLLEAPQDADFGTLRARAREARTELEQLKQGPLTAEQHRQVENVQAKLSAAIHVLGNAERRAEYDASRGNYRGIARCIAAGLTVTQLEQARNRFLPTRPGGESRARIQATSAEAHLVAGNLRAALDCLESALTEDPLTLRYHQRYWNLRRQAPQQPDAQTR